MKIRVSIFLIFLALTGYSQKSNVVQLAELKQEILHSNELLNWQNAMIAFQKNNSELCLLKKELHLFEKSQLSITHSWQSKNTAQEDLLLKFFRVLRITDELRDATVLKEKIFRTKFPQVVTHFDFDEIFHELYAPIQKARENYFKKVL